MILLRNIEGLSVLEIFKAWFLQKAKGTAVKEFLLGEAKSCGWVGRVCLKIKKRYIFAPSMVGRNLS